MYLFVSVATVGTSHFLCSLFLVRGDLSSGHTDDTKNTMMCTSTCFKNNNILKLTCKEEFINTKHKRLFYMYT